jgi:uncharacterized protein YyaL (SSP411 family)
MCLVGLLDLYEAGGDVAWLSWAQALWRTLNDRFWDAQGNGAYFAAPEGDPSILLRMKEDYDGAEPSASARAAEAAFRLAGLFNDESIRDRGRATFNAFAERLRSIPLAMPALVAAAALDAPAREAQVVIVGRRGAGATEALADAAFSVYYPSRRVIHLDFEDAACMEFWRGANAGVVAMAEPHAAETAGGGAAVALICAAQTCRPAVREPDALRALLLEAAAAGDKSKGEGGAKPAFAAFDVRKAFGGAGRATEE